MYTQPEQIIVYLETFLKAHATTLGLHYVCAAADAEEIVPAFPAAIIVAGSKSKEKIISHKFGIGLTAEIFIMHGDLTEDHRDRNIADMVLASAVEALLDNDPTLGGNVVDGYINGIDPGFVTRKKGTGIVITSKMSWIGISRSTFI